MTDAEKKVLGYMNSVKNIIKDGAIETMTMDQCIAIASMIQAEEHAQKQPNWDNLLAKIDATVESLPIGALHMLIMEMRNR